MGVNKGTAFERRLEGIFHAYLRQGRAKIHKTDPPVKVFGRPGHQRVRLLDNHWLDFAGIWTEQGGRAIMLEAKWTEKRLLPIDRSPGMSENQMANLRAWSKAGAATGVLWGMGNTIKLISVQMIDAAIADSGRVSIQWCDGIPVQPGEGFITHDILTTLAAFQA